MHDFNKEIILHFWQSVFQMIDIQIQVWMFFYSIYLSLNL